jgi:hypothetical protein
MSHLGRILSLILLVAAIHTTYAAPVPQTAVSSEYPELILHPSLPSLASLNITLADIVASASTVDGENFLVSQHHRYNSF